MRYFMMYSLFLIALAVIKILSKNNLAKMIFLGSIPFLFIIILNIYAKLVSNEILLGYLNIEDI
jgi:hypothetical protein